MFQAPTHSTIARRLFDCTSSTVCRSPYCHTVLNADGRVHTFAPSLPSSLHKFLHLFTFARPFLLLPFVPSLFFIVIFLYSHLYAHFFHRPQLYSSVGFIRRDYLLVCFSFHSSESSRNVMLLTHIPPYSPTVVFIMFILSTLGRCPLNVIPSKNLSFPFDWFPVHRVSHF